MIALLQACFSLLSNSKSRTSAVSRNFCFLACYVVSRPRLWDTDHLAEARRSVLTVVRTLDKRSASYARSPIYFLTGPLG